ncbi:MAG TPA: hypothetical protein VNO14_16260 [Blastocatellia bacterium]|nr:hypothetical protein [Blastocatellia bacterium]
MRSDLASIEFDLPWWAALIVCLAVLLPVARFCYSRLTAQAAALKVAVTTIRSLYTAALLLLALDATFTLIHAAGSRLHIIQLESAPPVERLARDRSLNERFQVSLISGALPELGDLLTVTSNGSEVEAAVVIAARSAEEAYEAVEIVTPRFAAPLFIALDSSFAATPDVSVISVSADGRAAFGVHTTVRATVHGRNMAGKRSRIELKDEVRPLAAAMVDWKTDDESAVVPLSFIPAVEGINRYVITVEQDEKEADAQNNELRFSLDVMRAGRRILFIEDQPTWEGKFIRRALHDNSQIRLDYFAQISRDAALAQLSSEGRRDIRGLLGTFRLLAGYDAIIAGPMQASYFSASEARNISDFVERRGGGLIFLGSNDFNGSIISPSSPLAHLTPADVSLERADRNQTETGEAEGGRSAVLAPTEEGLAEGLFVSGATGAALDGLGPISADYLKVRSLKPGASVFARDGTIAGEGSPALIAGQSYGLGRTLLVSPADLWRIRLAQAAGEQGRFAALWQNLVFWAASRAERPSYLRLADASLDAGRAATAYLTARDDSFNPLEAPVIEAWIEIIRRGDESAPDRIPVIIEPVSGSPGVYRLISDGLEEGEGAFIVAISAAGGGRQDLRLDFDVQPEKRTRFDLSGAQDRLERAAKESGGEVFTLQEADRIVAALMKLPAGSAQARTIFRLRDSLALAFLLPLLMAAEYFLRRRFTSGE